MNLRRSRLAAIFYFPVVLVITLLVLSALPQHAAPRVPASDVVFALDVAQSIVTWSLGTTFHTVHGSFALKKGTLRLDPATGKASGEIIVDAASGKSGNDSRDKKMHKEVLESGRYAEVVFRPDRVEGNEKVGGVRKARTLVHNPHVELSALPGPAHLNGAAGFERRICGITNQVDQQLFQLVRVSRDHNVRTTHDADFHSGLKFYGPPDPFRNIYR